MSEREKRDRKSRPCAPNARSFNKKPKLCNEDRRKTPAFSRKISKIVAARYAKRQAS